MVVSPDAIGVGAVAGLEYVVGALYGIATSPAETVFVRTTSGATAVGRHSVYSQFAYVDEVVSCEEGGIVVHPLVLLWDFGRQGEWGPVR